MAIHASFPHWRPVSKSLSNCSQSILSVWVLYAAPRPLLQETLASTTVLIFGSPSDDARSQAAAEVTAAKMLNREPTRKTSWPVPVVDGREPTGLSWTCR